MPSLKWLRASRAKWRAARAKAQAKINLRNRQIKRALKAQRGPERAAKFFLDHNGWHEDPGRPNRAAWLDKWARLIGEWMVGGPWCGLAVWMAARAGGKTLDKRVVSTVFIMQAAKAGTGGFKAWHLATATPKVGWVPVYGTPATGPVHTGMVVSSTRVGEGNTSAGANGSQNNGGQVAIRSLAERRGWILGYAEIDWS